jgi:hypothetical protein
MTTQTTAPEKPKKGSPCNGCGMCCKEETCKIGIEAFGNVSPCPALRFIGTRYFCGFVLAEDVARQEFPTPFLSNALGIRKGCDSDD